MAYLTRCTVSVVSKALNNDCNTVRSVALVYAVLVVVLFSATGSFLQQTVDVIIRDIVALSLLNKGIESGIVRRVSAAGFLYANED